MSLAHFALGAGCGCGSSSGSDHFLGVTGSSRMRLLPRTQPRPSSSVTILLVHHHPPRRPCSQLGSGRACFDVLILSAERLQQPHSPLTDSAQVCVALGPWLVNTPYASSGLCHEPPHSAPARCIQGADFVLLHQAPGVWTTL
jgi:hypothetical protein